ncbi:MAG: hypothetical protein IJJ28_05115, partial [Lentisphaeria bacterium]|nr:hypothetical protein [Lentisphaeria bacterium]
GDRTEVAHIVIDQRDAHSCSKLLKTAPRRAKFEINCYKIALQRRFRHYQNIKTGNSVRGVLFY